MTAQHLLWYLTRATGIMLGSARAASERWPRVVTAGLHKNLALVSTAFVIVHVLTTIFDPFVSISIAAAFVPFTSDYRPIWLSLGAISFDLLLAVLITSLLRDRLGHKVWRTIHLLVYACWPVALWHGLGTGTDTKVGWVLAITIACVLAVVAATWWRLSVHGSRTVRTTGLVVLATVALATVIFVAVGPMRSGWPARAGTPPALLGAARSTQVRG
jgi:methionine sulfoxide reductase heme-binding subunit